VVDVVGHQLRIAGHPDQDVGKLADLRESQAHQEGGSRRVAKQPNHDSPDRELPHHGQNRDRAPQGWFGDQNARVYESSDGDKKQRNKSVAQGKQLIQHFAAVPDSLTIRPARKAPNASDKPTAWVTAAVAKPRASTTSR